ncbi:MAG: sulfatase-like hydrolase/transferase [Planctomycetes bacterium]|nr:sulfatase-like hydrolase/transferase [Planctomycetota bacterium]
MRLLSHAPFVLALSTSVAAQSSTEQQPLPSAPLGNVLLIVADDVGCDMVGLFGQRPDAPPTPTLDALAASGVSFVSTYTDPICSPTRACILTGRYGFRTGFGSAIPPSGVDHSLASSEVTLPEHLRALAPQSIDNAAIGKWHLSAPPLNVALEPNLQGFDWFEGMAGNLFLGQTYFAHTKIRNGNSIPSTTYITTEQADDALHRTRVLQEPWFMYVAFNAGHAPWHTPPANLHGYALSGNPNATPEDHYRASVEAMDTELGRLLNGMDPEVRSRTTVIFIGDNGSPNEVATPPSVPGQSKGTLYEGGVLVPLIVSGPAVRYPGSRCYSLVNSVDVFPTVLELLHTPVSETQPARRELDGVSIVPYLVTPWRAPLRDWVYASRFAPNGFGPYSTYGRMVRSSRWKLIERDTQGDLFFDMASNQGESLNLAAGPMTPQQTTAYGRAKKALREIWTQ